jgi:hypothetical protein
MGMVWVAGMIPVGLPVPLHSCNTYPCVVLLICVGVSTLVYPREKIEYDFEIFCSTYLYIALTTRLFLVYLQSKL